MKVYDNNYYNIFWHFSQKNFRFKTKKKKKWTNDLSFKNTI